MSKSMCGCGCSIISSLMKRLGRSTCCSDLLSCSHTSDQLQRLSIECPSQPKKNVKAFASSDSLAKVQEVASWLLEMNQELLSVGSKRRRTGASLRGNASSSQVDEEQMNRVVEEEQQQQLRQQEEEHIARNGEIGVVESGLDDRIESQQEQLEENNNRLIVVDEESTGNHEEEEEEEHGGEQEEEVEEEEEMDQESDDFDQSDDSSREDEHTNSNSVTNSNSIMDLPIHQSSQFYIKSKSSLWKET
ncbi:F-box/WD repeat-containing protein 7 isoform X8 [Chrysemys picta bellii]|uniref:F-box/WD repeat-containing protein 7 isoform X8 n=1 Tax=Chrysemys picta bellii TaxID=8478 RepID=UPI000CE64BC2